MNKIVIIGYQGKFGIITDFSIISGKSEFSDSTPGNWHGILLFGEEEAFEVPKQELKYETEFSTSRDYDEIIGIVEKPHELTNSINNNNSLKFLIKNTSSKEENIKKNLESTGLIFSVLFYSVKDNHLELKLRDENSMDDIIEIIHEIEHLMNLKFIGN